MRAHIIQPGEHLDGLCARLGADPEQVWNASENSDLRAQRRDRNILAPGDVVFLPEPTQTSQPMTLRSTNSYRAQVPTTRVEVTLSEGNETLANEAYVVEGTEPQLEGQSDGSGTVSLELPAHMREAVLSVPGRELSLRLMIGHLDPEDSPDGVHARLSNLGYLVSYPRSRPPTAEARAAELAAAVSRFQHDQGLPETGEVDDETRTALRQLHGT